MKKLLLCLVLAIVGNLSLAQSIDHWEAIIQMGDSCKYFVPSSDIGTAWISPNFNDSSWPSGPSGFGFGDNDDPTTIPNRSPSVYIRHSFHVDSVSQIASLLLDMDFDDGFVAYLNGVEVARANVEDPISWNMELARGHVASLNNGDIPERFPLNYFIPSLLKDGENILAVEVHNRKANNGTLTSNVFLHAGLTDSKMLYQSPVSWFWEPFEIKDSKLPLMIINTNGQTIPDEPRITADMGLIYNGEGNTNSMHDNWNEYDGKISIEIRGESSQHFAKKSYSIELQKADGSNNNVSILGLPKENDFVLYGPYSDKTLIKNVLTYELYRLTGRWAPRTRYIEVFIDDDYKGIYVLTEKLKRDKNRVAINKLTSNDTTAEDISGGYILRRDKTTKLDPEEFWASPVQQIYFEPLKYQYYDPEFKDLTRPQAQYIRSWMEKYDEMISGFFFKHPTYGYKGYIDARSFMDMMFINEISKGIDNYMFSTYFYKEHEEDGGQLVAGPPWDYNLSYGNLDYGHNHNIPYTHSWVYDNWSRVYWYKRLMEDPEYRDKVRCRWTDYRSTIYSDENIEHIIDSCVLVLSDAIDRNFERFPILGKYVWPNAFYPDSHEKEIRNLKSWLKLRLEWIDGEWITQEGCPQHVRINKDTLKENRVSGTMIGIFSAYDSHSGYLDEFEFVDGPGFEDNQKFTISKDTLFSSQPFDFEKKSSYTIRIHAVNSDFENTESIIEINILDEHEIIVSQADIKDPSFNEGRKDTIPGREDLPLFLYPNPTSDIIQIMGQEHSELSYVVQLYGLTGRQIGNYSGPLTEINSRLEADSRGLTRGMYLIKIQTEGQALIFKFIKS